MRSLGCQLRWCSSLLSALSLSRHWQVPAVPATPQDTNALPSPVSLTAEQDHKRIMDLLHIASCGRAPMAETRRRQSANYDEAKAISIQAARSTDLKEWEEDHKREGLVAAAAIGNH